MTADVEREPAELLLRGASVLAPEPTDPGTCVAVRGQQIVAVADEAVARRALGEAAATVDLDGFTLAPGFIDAHVHPMPAAFFEHHLDVARCASLADLHDLLSDRARTTVDGGVVLALRLDDSQLAEGRLPTREELDRVTTEHPVVVMRRDGHHAIGSSSALALAGFHPGVEDPAGGSLGRAADGSLDGLCAETAASMLLGIVPTPEWDDLAAGLRRWTDRLVAQGVTSIGAMCQTGAEGPAGAAGELEAVAFSALVDQLPLDVQSILITGDVAEVGRQRATALHDPARGRRVDAMKLFLDGTLGGHSACLHHPYGDRSGSTGMLTLDPDQAYDRIEAAHLAGWAVCVHAIGDRTNTLAVELFERLLQRHPAAHRHRVEHASVLTDDTVERLAALGVAAVVQPISIRSEADWLEDRMGADRLDRVYRYRDLLDAGVVVAGSSDSPIEESDVVAAMDAAVRRGPISPSQAVTPHEALAMYTTGAAWAIGAEQQGRIAAGALADLVVLEGAPAIGWHDVTVAATIRRGTLTHSTDEHAGRFAAVAGAGRAQA
jgi:predicted amidohydrolase YtcJ